MHADHRLHLDDAGGNLDQAQAKRVELGDAPHRAPRHRDAKLPHQPISAGVEEEAELVGGRLGAGGPVGGQMGLEGFDVVLGLTAPAVEIFVERACVAPRQVGDDEACIRPFRADLDAGDDALDAAPTLSAVVEFLEPAQLALLRRGLKTRLGRGFKRLNMAAQRRGRRDAQNVVETGRATEIENLRRSSGCRRAEGFSHAASGRGSPAASGAEKV